MKKIYVILPLLALLLVGADRPVDTIRLTIINKSGMEIAIQLRSSDYECANSKDIVRGDFYYLTIPKGDRETPAIKAFDIQKNTYGMQLFYIETYDPVYGFKCKPPAPNALQAARNLRLTVLPCDFPISPKQVGEPSMFKFLPFPVQQYGIIFQRYWLTRLVH
ncbi:MAG: hypothetical protein B6D39_07330 [Anaerolineae bacterium UTCFX2]|jgi:hypothetical protein|nr:hypothetical protein [Anaerolineae bacterium]MCZ7552030.1 hypothetical protein [Anaerolineales bacterium]OQY90960.1 MAG: hypothetical protein B6D39_07330 [Anaerolineae bacterium UTCFX2]